jgi:hypothetical protein
MRASQEIIDDIEKLEQRFYNKSQTPMPNSYREANDSFKKRKIDSRDASNAKKFSSEMSNILGKIPIETWKFEKESDRIFNE